MKKTPPILSLQAKLSGNTLIEVLISLSILSLVFLMGMGLFQQITGIYSPNQRFKTRSILQEALLHTDYSQIPLEEELVMKGRLLRRQISWIDKHRALVEVRISCYWGEEEIDHRQRVICLHNLPKNP